MAKATGWKEPEERTARSSDDEYCSAYPSEPRHHYIGHSVEAPPIRFIDRCQFCGHISSRSLRRQLAEGAPSARPTAIF